ncbi:MAG: biotin/lipoyl-containing protein, partial [Arenibacter sp.]|nr:biotin/lipoyl-containing protein [Arenibacter sp.]
MSKFELKLPQMGESVAEATLTSWLKEVGDTIEMDEAVFEIATDKVDSEVPSEVDGVLVEKLFDVDDVIQVGQTVAILELSGAAVQAEEKTEPVAAAVSEDSIQAVAQTVEVAKEVASPAQLDFKESDRFYSPLVKNIAKQEGIEVAELDTIPGTGSEGRVTKNDILAYLENRKSGATQFAKE